MINKSLIRLLGIKYEQKFCSLLVFFHAPTALGKYYANRKISVPILYFKPSIKVYFLQL